MKNVMISTAMGAMVLATMLFMVGCSDDSSAKKKGSLDTIIDTIAADVAEGMVDAAFANTLAEEKEHYGPKLADGRYDFDDILLVDSTLYAVYDGGVVIYDMASKEPVTIDTDEEFNAIGVHDGSVFVGGEALYAIEDTLLIRLDVEFDGIITSLYSYGYRLMIGTDCGLFSMSESGEELLMDEVVVTDMACDGDGLWVGTDGQGLFRWDGDGFHKRFLLRDTTIFDIVNSVTYSHQHLYLGTDVGLFIYDGGCWLQLTVADGLPSDIVETIDASSWMILVGTTNGVISYYNNEFLPVVALEEKRVNAFQRFGRNIIAATDHEGVIMKSGKTVATLITPNDDVDNDTESKPEDDVFSFSAE
ncbi:MAG: hypothetical protein JW763_02000 [candidate division Zixibacteria bacterium]|nr:hypothetical protein [candidate division Zixibacteria bacterium]